VGVALLQECEAEVPMTVSLPLAESFDSADLDGEFTRMGLDSVLHKEVVEAPANKRRKIDVELDVLGEVTAKLNSLLGSQDAMDLDGLGHVAQSVNHQ
jgi:hypothetical protein